MPYHNQIQNAIINPKGIDKVIEDICAELSSVSWLSNIFRRAWLINDANGGTSSLTPQVYLQDMEYYKVLPNDNFTALSFVTVTSPERYVSDMSNKNYEAEKERDLSLIVWCNLQMINPSLDYIFTEILKEEIEIALSKIVNISSYVDEDYRQIFSGYDISEIDNKFFAYPYAAFRFNFTANYGGKLRTC